MKKLYINNGGSVIFDPETNEMKSARQMYTNIRTLYYIEEECDVVAQAGEQKFEAHVVPGDIIIHFYRDDKPNRFIVLKNEAWKQNIEEDIAREQKEKEEWAAKQAKGMNLDSCCENCPKCDAA